MTDKILAGKTIAILVANGFEETDMTEPQRALLSAGAQLKTVSPEQALVNGWHEAAWGHYFPVDTALGEALAADFDALLVPGGSRGVEKLAGNPHTKRFLKGFVDGNKPVVLIADATALLVVVERAAGKTVAADESVAGALTEAGAILADEQIAADGAILTVHSDAEADKVREAVLKHVAEIVEQMADAA